MFLRKKLILLSLFVTNGICIYNFISSQYSSSEEKIISKGDFFNIWKLDDNEESKTLRLEQSNNGGKSHEENLKTPRKEKFTSSKQTRKQPHTPERGCPIRWNPNQNAGSDQEPMINLDRDRFLASVPTNGPNNQLVGARESIFVAIRLNRTLVIPTFYKHRSDDQISNGSFIHPGHRIDLAFLRRLVPVVTLDYFRDKCRGKVDAVFRVRKITTPKYKGLEEKLKMTLLARNSKTGKVTKDNPALELTEYPLNADLHKKLKHFTIHPEEKSVRKLYPGKETCAVFPSAFRNLKVDTRAPTSKPPKTIDLNEISSPDLYTEVIRHTRTPRHVVAMAEDFVGHVMKGRPFLAIHWRFDRKDWMRRCLAEKPWGRAGRLQLCKEVQAFQPIDIARAIVGRARNVSTDVKIDDVYIAYPVVDKDVIQDAAVLLKKDFKLRVFTHEDLLTFWSKEYSPCDWLWIDRDDLLSSTEMEICGKATDFIRSKQSTWSSMIVLRREENASKAEQSDKNGITYYIKIEKNRRESKV